MENGRDHSDKTGGKNHPLKRSIFTHMVVIPFIPFVLAVGVSFYYFAGTLEKTTINSLKRIVSDHCDMIDTFLMERQADLELITHTYTLDEILAPSAVDTVFSHLKQRSAAFVDLGVFDRDGTHRRYAGDFPRLQGRAYGDTPWFRKVIEQGRFISDVFTGYRGIPHFIIAVRRGQGDSAWVLRATIDTLAFERRVSGVQMGRTGESYLLNTDGILQTRRRSGGIAILEKDPDFMAMAPAMDLSSPGTPITETAGGAIKGDKIIHTFIRDSASGGAYLYAVTRLNNRDWHLVVRQEKKDAYKALYTAIYITVMIMVVGGAVIVVAAIYMTEHILGRLETLDMEKQALGNQLIRAVQLAEIGEMAAGFAHEINNPLQIIKGEQMLIDTLLDEIPTTAVDPQTRADIRDSMDQIQLQVNRCSEITHAILKFGRKNDVGRTLLNPVEMITGVVRMVEQKARVDGIRMNVKLDPATPGFQGDGSQFQQVMLNLINNAMDAVLERHGTAGGILDISAQPDGSGQVRIGVADNGAGIAPEHMDKVFSPFFTTKPVGKGTGLGLSVCYGIIRALGGEMSVTSRPEQGTTFVVTLPSGHHRAKKKQGGKGETDEIAAGR